MSADTARTVPVRWQRHETYMLDRKVKRYGWLRDRAGVYWSPTGLVCAAREPGGRWSLWWAHRSWTAAGSTLVSEHYQTLAQAVADYANALQMRTAFYAGNAS